MDEKEVKSKPARPKRNFAKPNHYNLSQSEYERLADCCVKSVQQIQEQFPKISDFKKVEASINIRCPSYEDD